MIDQCSRLFDLGVFHGDIKDENIIISTHNLRLTLIDFGSAQAFDRNLLKSCQISSFFLFEFSYSFSTAIINYSSNSPQFSVCHGTPEYFPPECFTMKSYDAREKTVWSIGTVAFILLFGYAPFDSTQSIILNRMRPVSILCQ